MRFIFCFVFTLFWAVPHADAQTDSVFPDYEAYAAFVDKQIMTRDFIPLILQLGGRDEYTPEQLASNNENLRRVWRKNFDSATVFKREDLGGGLSQEGRMYWTDTGGYAFFYALLHQRDDRLVVISFLLNSSSKTILERF